MQKPAILALIRQILTIADTALVAKGYVQASDIEPVIGALLSIGSVVWSVADKRRRCPSVVFSVRSLKCGYRAISAPHWKCRLDRYF